MLEWKVEDKGVRFGDVLIAYREGADRAVYGGRFDYAREVLRMLQQARRAFATGKADYHDAAANVGRLLIEKEKAEEALGLVIAEVDGLFASPVTGFFKDDDGSRIQQFIEEVVK